MYRHYNLSWLYKANMWDWNDKALVVGNKQENQVKTYRKIGHEIDSLRIFQRSPMYRLVDLVIFLDGIYQTIVRPNVKCSSNSFVTVPFRMARHSGLAWSIGRNLWAPTTFSKIAKIYILASNCSKSLNIMSFDHNQRATSVHTLTLIQKSNR